MPSITDPNLNLKGFFPLLLNAFGTWGGTTYGLPFDNYSGLLFYNKCMLKDAGFDKPPATWDEVMNTYAPKLTDPAKKQYAYALQSLRGETQSADSFMRVLWPFGGSLLDKTFHSNLMSKDSQAGLDFRQKLMKYMPPGVVSWDHAEAVNALAQGQVAMITEWSAFYPTLTDPEDLQARRLPRPSRPSPPARPAACRRSAASRSRSPARRPRRSRRPPGSSSSGRPRRPSPSPMSRPAACRAAWRSTTTPTSRRTTSSSSPWWPPGRRACRSSGRASRPGRPSRRSSPSSAPRWMLGEVSVADGAKEIGTRMEAVLKKDGYYDGKKKLLQ